MCGKKLQRSCSENDGFINIVEGLQNKVEDEDLELTAVVARNMWFRRNCAVYGGAFSHRIQLVRRALESPNDFKNAIVKVVMLLLCVSLFVPHWLNKVSRLRI
jgi:hypothetical protein